MGCLVVNYNVRVQAETKTFVSEEEVGDEGEAVEAVEKNIDS